MKRRKPTNGIALFILLTSLVILSLGLKEILVVTGLQADRVRYQYNRLQAIYLARSAQSLARFFLIYDLQIDTQVLKDEASDTPSDIWAHALPFPVPAEVIQAMSGQLAEGAGLAEKNSTSSAAPDEALLKKCDDFFSDFPGDAVSHTTDLSSRINLNDLGNSDVFAAFLELLQIDPQFLQSLTSKGLNPESLARQIRDYMDDDSIEKETNAQENEVYQTEQLDYGAKNRPFTHLDELKMIPSVDDEIYEYLSPFVSSVYLAHAGNLAKINLNTVSKEVFQSLLKSVSDPAQIAEDFVKDRAEKKRIYTAKNYAKVLEDNFGLDTTKIRLPILTGVSDMFRIETKATVNKVQISLEGIMGRGLKRPRDPFATQRISP